jgi:RNA polymerase sigma-70 factor (ECF subfamily)
MQLIRDGSESAARELLEIYGDHILRIIRRRLHRGMRGQFDSIDFQQAVWASFFALPPERMTFQTAEELAMYLSTMAGFKVAEAFRGQIGTVKRSVLRQRSLDDVGEGNPCIIREHEATPSQRMVAEERWEQLNEGQSPVVRQILTMRKDGHSYEDIARVTGLHLKAIQRFLKRLKKDVP